MIEGQYLDMSYEGRRDISMDDYLRMISRKTGALIRCSLNLGAAVGTDDPATIAAMRECGRALGYVFQIRDDVLGVWGEEEITGKPVGADIRRKKNSYPVVYTMEAAEDEDRASILAMYTKPELDDRDVDSVLAIMEKTRVRERAQTEAARMGGRGHTRHSARRTAPPAPRADRRVHPLPSRARQVTRCPGAERRDRKITRRLVCWR